MTLRHEQRQKLLAKLTTARYELEDALNLSTPAARYDPIVLSETLRTKLVSMISDLNDLLHRVESSQ